MTSAIRLHVSKATSLSLRFECATYSEPLPTFGALRLPVLLKLFTLKSEWLQRQFRSVQMVAPGPALDQVMVLSGPVANLC